MMVPLRHWGDLLAERQQDEEALRTMFWNILDRTLRDLFTYRDRRTKRRAWYYDNAYNWLFCYDPDDLEVPMSFAYVCDILGLDPDSLAKAVWDHRHLTFRELKAEVKRQEKARAARELQRGREEDDTTRGRPGELELSFGSARAS